MGPFQPQDKQRPALHPTEDAIDMRARVPEPDEAATVPRAWLDEDGAIEIGSSMFIDEAGRSPASDDAMTTLVGQLISGRYRVDAIAGRGGLGAVYVGEQIHLHKRVAIKVLRAGTEQMPGLVERFEREAVAGAHVQHPNVAAAIDFGKLDSGAYFLVSEYVEGKPLSQVLAAGPLAPARALRIARQMADALAAVHAKGILHRDIKPQNTLVGDDDRVKIIDFGLAKVDIASTTGQTPAITTVPLTGVGDVFGTIAYLAPEAELGMCAVDARSDLYAVGVTLYEMLCGRRPFSAPDRVALFLLQRTQDPPPFHVRAPGVTVPAAAERVAMRLVQRKPADRYATARETMDAIDEALRALEGSAGTVVMATSPPVPVKMGTSPPIPATLGTPSSIPATLGAPSSIPADAPVASQIPRTVVERVGAAEAPGTGAASPGGRVPRVAIVIGAILLGSLFVVGLVVMLVRGFDSDDDDSDAPPARTVDHPHGVANRDRGARQARAVPAAVPAEGPPVASPWHAPGADGKRVSSVGSARFASGERRPNPPRRVGQHDRRAVAREDELGRRLLGLLHQPGVEGALVLHLEEVERVATEAGAALRPLQEQPEGPLRQLGRVEHHVGHVPGPAALDAPAHEDLARLVVGHVAELDPIAQELRRLGEGADAGELRLLLEPRDGLGGREDGRLRVAGLPPRQAQVVVRVRRDERADLAVLLQLGERGLRRRPRRAHHGDAALDGEGERVGDARAERVRERERGERGLGDGPGRGHGLG